MTAPFVCCIFVKLGCRWGVEVGEPELLAVKAANLVGVSAAAAAESNLRSKLENPKDLQDSGVMKRKRSVDEGSSEVVSINVNQTTVKASRASPPKAQKQTREEVLSKLDPQTDKETDKKTASAATKRVTRADRETVEVIKNDKIACAPKPSATSNDISSKTQVPSKTDPPLKGSVPKKAAVEKGAVVEAVTTAVKAVAAVGAPR